MKKFIFAALALFVGAWAASPAAALTITDRSFDRPADGTPYMGGESAMLTVTFSEAVTVGDSDGGNDGALRATFDVGGGATFANVFAGVSGEALTFSPSFLAFDVDADGIQLVADSLQLMRGGAVVTYPAIRA